MKFIQKNLLIIILINFFGGCQKEDLCNSFPCDNKYLTIKNFNSINYRKGTWISTTNYLERTTKQDTIIFETDSIWSLPSKDLYWPNGSKAGIYHKKYLLQTKTNLTSNSGVIQNYATFNDSATTTYRTYNWYFDTLTGFVYIDFNFERRSISEPVVYSRFIKIK